MSVPHNPRRRGLDLSHDGHNEGHPAHYQHQLFQAPGHWHRNTHCWLLRRDALNPPCALRLLHIYLQRLWEAIAKLPAIFPNGRRLDEGTHPWLMNDLAGTLPTSPQTRFAAFRAASLVSILGGYWLVPASIVAFGCSSSESKAGASPPCTWSSSHSWSGAQPHYTRLRHKTLGRKVFCLSFDAIVSWICTFVIFSCGLSALLAAFYCAFLVLEWDKRMDPFSFFLMGHLDPGYTPSRQMFMGEQILWVVSKMGN